MSDVTIVRSDRVKRAGRKPDGVTKRQVTTENGDKVTIRPVDANSPTFLYVFSKNVEAARKENKRLFGSADGVKPRP